MPFTKEGNQYQVNRASFANDHQFDVGCHTLGNLLYFAQTILPKRWLDLYVLAGGDSAGGLMFVENSQPRPRLRFCRSPILDRRP
jgi:hypothetical protein